MSRILNSIHAFTENAEFRTKENWDCRNQDNGKIVFAGFRTTKQ